MKRKTGKELWIVFGGIAFVSATMLTAFLTFYWPLQLKYEPSYVTVPKGASVKQVAGILKGHQLIRSKTMFIVYTKITKSSGRLRAGTFALSPNYSIANILGHLTHESGVAEYTKVTIPEGFDLKEIDAALSTAKVLEKGTFLQFLNTQAKSTFAETYPFLTDAPSNLLEGYLFPDTYYFSSQDTAKTVVEAFLKAFDAHIWQYYQNIPDSNAYKKRYTFHELLTMASIVQKEARVISEMPRIASVYYNRLKKGQRLEADPTVVYGLGYSRKDRVYYKDLKKITPYNTYRKKGLTPTPIASPGKKAFEASLFPETTGYYFFVANPNGSHTFTKTYQEHLSVQRKSRRGSK